VRGQKYVYRGASTIAAAARRPHLKTVPMKRELQQNW